MTSMAERLRRVRAELNLNQRDMAEKLGVGMSTYQSFETSRVPKGQVFVQLAEMGFDGHWLLTGEGNPHRVSTVAKGPERSPAVVPYPQGPLPGQSYGRYRADAPPELARSMRLKELGVAARSGSQGTVWRLASVMAEAAPDPVASGALLSAVQKSTPGYVRADLESDLYGLKRQCLVAGDVSTGYRLAGEDIRLKSHTVGDVNQHVVQAMGLLANDVAVGLESEPKTARLMTAKLRVSDLDAEKIRDGLFTSLESGVSAVEERADGACLSIILGVSAAHDVDVSS